MCTATTRPGRWPSVWPLASYVSYGFESYVLMLDVLENGDYATIINHD